MFALGFIRGTVFGISVGLLLGMAAKNICKKKKNKIKQSN